MHLKDMGTGNTYRIIININICARFACIYNARGAFKRRALLIVCGQTISLRNFVSRLRRGLMSTLSPQVLEYTAIFDAALAVATAQLGIMLARAA
jgi:hypothetical protein